MNVSICMRANIDSLSFVDSFYGFGRLFGHTGVTLRVLHTKRCHFIQLLTLFVFALQVLAAISSHAMPTPNPASRLLPMHF